jgi:hypothetical protein
MRVGPNGFPAGLIAQSQTVSVQPIASTEPVGGRSEFPEETAAM